MCSEMKRKLVTQLLAKAKNTNYTKVTPISKSAACLVSK